MRYIPIKKQIIGSPEEGGTIKTFEFSYIRFNQLQNILQELQKIDERFNEELHWD